MTESIETARTHYEAAGLTARLRHALRQHFPDDRTLTVTDLAALDQFHTRGLLATRDLAASTPIDRNTRVLDIGCGIGGPARFVASTYGCAVTGIDLSDDFVEAARHLTECCDLSRLVDLRVGNALELPFDDGSFDLVLMQHVAMNIADRTALYAGIARVLRPGGRLAAYDVVTVDGDVHYPTPWSRDAASSFLLTAARTREALVDAGLDPVVWRDESALAAQWFATTAAAPPSGPTLALVLGADFRTMAGNLGRNLVEGRIGILAVVAERR